MSDRQHLPPEDPGWTPTKPPPKAADAAQSVRPPSAATVHVRNKAELQEAFEAWVEQHGYIWFDADLTLAMSLASYLGISDFKIDGVRV